MTDTDQRWLDTMTSRESTDSQVINFRENWIVKITSNKYKSNPKFPFHDRISDVFVNVAQDLIKEFRSSLAYTYKTDIYLFFPTDNERQKINKSKFLSGICSYAGVRFNSYLQNGTIEPPCPVGSVYFSGNAFQMKSEQDAFNYLYWKVSRGAINYSIDTTANVHFTKKELQGKSNLDRVKMLGEKGIQWNKAPDAFKYGILVKRKLVPETVMVKGKKGKNREVKILRSDGYSRSMNIPGYTTELSKTLFSRILSDTSEWSQLKS